MRIVLLFVTVLFTSHIAGAQDTCTNKDSIMKFLPNSVAVNENNLVEFNIPLNATTHIISPEPILYVDISTPDVEGDIQEKNIVRIKPSANFTENQNFTITVVTRVFVAVYKLIGVNPAKSFKDSNPVTYVITVDPTQAVQLNQGNSLSQQQCYALSMQALSKKRKIRNIKSNAYDLSFRVNNIYIVGDYLLFDIGARNKSKLQFDLDQVRFKIKDKFTINATVSQDLELQPMFQFYSNENSVITDSWRNIYIFKKFTYPTQKIFSIEFTEQQISGRKVELKIGYHQVLKSRFLL
jgi:conjugative transposon TraN protein